MKQRITSLFLILILCISMLGACSNEGNVTDTSTQTENENNTEKESETNNDSENDVTTESETESETTTTEIKVITIAEALELCGDEGNITTERYYIRGTVTEMKNATYGEMVISDDTGSIYVYGTYSADGSLKYSEMEEKAFKGDTVLLSCILQNYNGTKEVQNARLMEFEKAEITFDETQYKDMSISQIRDAAQDTLVKTDGVVAAITYANGMVPNGIILVDDTQSIYVYDTNLASQVKVGNTITIIGKKTYWILDTEISNADKFGYKGCCQIDSATLINNDKKTSDYNKSWITESTVKDILDNPVNKDITTTIFKVNALVNKVDGSGFTNYYFNDLDGTTGSYTYTQCSGSDFSWLDKYDGKICTVYLMAINAKSGSSGCVYRFYPVEVIDEGYQFDTNNAAEHIVKYYGVDQFLSYYSGDPALELLTKVSSDLLGFKDATLTYSSDNTKVITFSEKDGKTIMNCVGTGTAKVTITGSYNGKTYSQTISIDVEVANEEKYDYVNVADAIKVPVGESVTVKGIVGPSLVNRDGFYLIDESGVIAVLTSTDVLATLEIGQEVILKGDRDLFQKDATKQHGQTCINNAEVVVNNYGNHPYSTASFNTESTLADFYNLDVMKDYSTQVFVVKATVELVETAFYTNMKLTSGDISVSLYCSSAKQYSWLNQFAGQEVTMELAPCNWNGKTYYAGCVLAVYTDNGKVLNTLVFDN